MAGLYGALVFGALFLGGGLLSVRDYCNYRRITANPSEVQGKILKIVQEEQYVNVRLEYAVDNQAYHARRQVGWNFDKKFRVGDAVTIQYLRGHPEVARVKDFDLDDRMWVLQAIFCAFLLTCLSITLPRLRKQATGRAEEQVLRWAPKDVEGKWVSSVMPAALETSYAAWLERHRGWLVIQSVRLLGPGSEAKRPRSIHNMLLKKGVQSKVVGKGFVVLAPSPAETFLGWLGWEPKRFAVYWVLDCQDIDQVEQFVMENLAGNVRKDGSTIQRKETFWNLVRFMCCKGVVGPFAPDEVSSARSQFVQAGIQRFAYWEPESGLLDADLGPIMSLAGPDERLSLLIRRRKRYEILARPKEEKRAELFSFDGREWRHEGSVRLPSALKDRSRTYRAFLSLIGGRSQ